MKSAVPLGFNADGSEPAAQGPYYTGAGFNVAIGRPVADEHYKMCLEAGVKISGINAEVMPGQWEFQVGPCRGIETLSAQKVSTGSETFSGTESGVHVSFFLMT